MYFLELITLLLEYFLSIVANVLVPVELVITQFAIQVKIRLVSQLIKCISRVLQKLLQCFYGAAVLTFVALPAEGFTPVILALNWYDWESVILAHLNNISINAQVFLNNWHYIPLIILASQHSDATFLILLSIKSPVSSAFFQLLFFEVVLRVSVANCVTRSRCSDAQLTCLYCIYLCF